MNKNKPIIPAIIKLATISGALCAVGAALANGTHKELEAIVYGDNFFDFFVNGRKMASDTRLLPHTVFKTTIKLKTSGENVLSVYLRDNANAVNGLEWGNRCIGDGGFRLRLSDDSVVTNSEWKCRTVHYGPVNPGQCFGLGLDPTGNRSAFGPDGESKTKELSRPTSPIFSCRDDRPVPVTDMTEGQNGYFYPESCETAEFEWFAQQTTTDRAGNVTLLGNNGRVRHAEWAMPGYDDSSWDRAIEFSDETVGWGVTPSTVSGPPWQGAANGESWGPRAALPHEMVEFADPAGIRPVAVTNPPELEWGESKFIWRPSLRFDNPVTLADL